MLSDNGRQLKYNDAYLERYGNARIHQTMINDSVRTETYRKAIGLSRHLIKDKIVMDVGCGTGILSLFAAKAGAKRVIAVESSEIADAAKQVVIDNRMDHIITVVKGRLEDIRKLPDGIEKVDVIVSEFMGYSLIYEGMFDTIIYARDKWLKSNGVILPDQCSLYIFGLNDGVFKRNRIEFYQEITVEDDKFNFSSLKNSALRKAWKRSMSSDDVVTDSQKLFDIDMNTVTTTELRCMQSFYKLTATKKPSGICHGLGTYFTVNFSKCHGFYPIEFSTSPMKEQTHWGQSVFYFHGDVEIEYGSTLSGFFAYRKHPRYPRDLEFVVEATYNGKNEMFSEKNKYLSI